MTVSHMTRNTFVGILSYYLLILLDLVGKVIVPGLTVLSGRHDHHGGVRTQVVNRQVTLLIYGCNATCHRSDNRVKML